MNLINRFPVSRILSPQCSIIKSGQQQAFTTGSRAFSKNDFTKDEVARYTPQLLCPGLGKKAQMNIKYSSVLIVGLGGLGSASAQFLTAAGIGRLGLVDSAKVKLPVLQRQILHSESAVGESKVQSAAEALLNLNSNVSFDAHELRLSRENAMDLVQHYDMVIDATDNPMAKYLINDVCLLLKKPMITGSALRFDGYVTVFNFDENSPCYRCALPKSIPAAMTPKVADVGLFSPVAGFIGNIQAQEALKIAAGLKPSFDSMALAYSSLNGKFEYIQIPKKGDDCEGCGKDSKLTKELIDYDEFCSVIPLKPVKILAPEERITVQEYDQVLKAGRKHLLIDVRPQNQQDIVKLENAVTVTLEDIVKGNGVELIQNMADQLIKADPQSDKHEIYVMCRKGNASQRAVKELKSKLAHSDEFEIKDIIGGIEDWAKKVDKEMPIY